MGRGNPLVLEWILVGEGTGQWGRMGISGAWGDGPLLIGRVVE